MRSRLIPAFAVLVALLAWTAVAEGAVPQSLKDACTLKNPHAGYSYMFCDDGLPPVGGTTVNTGAISAVPVPAKYDGYEGLPAKAADADTMAGADTNGDVALDVDISIPTIGAPPGGYPLIVAMHGCCSGSKTDAEATTFDAGSDRWHYNNAWGASRGYVVVTYTARGFVNGENHGNKGSTGESQLDSREFEINDFQYLAGLIADDSFFDINPQKVVATGGSYGGGFSWLALTDPIWQSPDAQDMKLAAVAPKYPSTDHSYSLVPTGRHSHSPADMPAFDGSDTLSPFGVPKRSLVNLFYFSGKTGIPSGEAHSTWPTYIDDSYNCLISTDPFETNPLCDSLIDTVAPDIVQNRSAYYQGQWFDKIDPQSSNYDPDYIVPVFSASTFTDPLFTSIESVRMANRIHSLQPDYPIQEYYGDYAHFVQNKAKEWADTCGSNRHVCQVADYAGGATKDVNGVPPTLRRVSANTRLNRFIDYYAEPSGVTAPKKPSFNVTTAAQICPQNATMTYPADEPGRILTAPRFDSVTNNNRVVDLNAVQTSTTNDVNPNTHADGADPFNNFVFNGGKCPVTTTQAEAGVAVYESDPLSSSLEMAGAATVTIDYTATDATNLELNSRLYDVFPNGMAVMVDRGPRRVAAASGTVAYELHGNGWNFASGHKLRVEVAQDDDPFVKSSVVPSSAEVTDVSLSIPEHVSADRDGDGFTDESEAIIGTDPDDSCQDSNEFPDYILTAGDNAWPLDLNNDANVSVGDIGYVVMRFGSSLPRGDLNADGFISVGEIGQVVMGFGGMC